MATKAHANGLKMPGFGNDGDSAAAPCRGLLIDFFNQTALYELTGNFGDAGGRKLALFGYLDARYRTLLVDKTINRCAVKLFYEINVANLSLSASRHAFIYSVTTSLPLTMVLMIL